MQSGRCSRSAKRTKLSLAADALMTAFFRLQVQRKERRAGTGHSLQKRERKRQSRKETFRLRPRRTSYAPMQVDLQSSRLVNSIGTGLAARLGTPAYSAQFGARAAAACRFAWTRRTPRMKPDPAFSITPRASVWRSDSVSILIVSWTCLPFFLTGKAYIDAQQPPW